MPNASGSPHANRILAIVVGGFFAAWFLIGLPWGLIWLAGFATYAIFQWKVWAGIIFGVLAAAFFIGPAAMDERVLESQLAQIEAQERSVAPIDLTGRSVLFVGGSRYLPWDCSDLCRALVEYGNADAVYFGHNRSLDLRFSGTPIDLTDRVIHMFPYPLDPGLPEDTPSVEVSPGEIDYVILEGPYFSRDVEGQVLPDVSPYGIYPANTLWVEYMVFEAGDLRAFNPLEQEPLITRFEYNRYSHTFPGLPFLPLGDIDFSHQHDPGLTQWVSANGREVGAMLCGPVERPFYHTCAVVRE